MSTLKTNNLQLLDQSRIIAVSKIAEMNGGFSFRNKIVDGRFDFWYEGTTQSTSGYGSSTMWMNSHNGSTKVASRQPLVAGVDLPANDCPSAQYFLRNIVTSTAGANNYVILIHKIEDVSTLSGKTSTLSFYAKADSTKNITVWLYQNFGSGGTVAVDGIGNQLVGLTTSWKRYSVQITLPSISGKTIGTSSYISIGFGFDLGSGLTQFTNSCGQQSGTFDIACIQLEEGSVMTPFEELPIEVSKSRVGRYANLITFDSGVVIFKGYQPSSSASGVFPLVLPQTMIQKPVVTIFGTFTYSNTSAFVCAPFSNSVFGLSATVSASGGYSVTAGTNSQILFDARL